MDTCDFDVFLSYNRDDKSDVEVLASKLRKRGIKPWLDRWNLVPGTPWQPEIESALHKCQSCAVFVGKTGLGPWQNEEMRAAIQRRVSDSEGKFRVIPVLLPGARKNGNQDLPAFLVATTWVEFANILDDKDAFHRLVSGIRGLHPGPGRHRGAERTEYILVLSAKATEATKAKIDAVLEHLRELSGDATITIKKVQSGSIRITLEGSLEGFAKLQALITTGSLTDIVGMEISEFARADELPDQPLLESRPAQNIQDSMLNTVRKDKSHVTIYLLSGVKLSGRIRSFDKYSVILEANNQEQLIFKHAISTVVISKEGRRTTISPQSAATPDLELSTKTEREHE